MTTRDIVAVVATALFMGCGGDGPTGTDTPNDTNTDPFKNFTGIPAFDWSESTPIRYYDADDDEAKTDLYFYVTPGCADSIALAFDEDAGSFRTSWLLEPTTADGWHYLEPLKGYHRLTVMAYNGDFEEVGTWDTGWRQFGPTDTLVFRCGEWDG